MIKPEMIGLNCDRILVMTDEINVPDWKENLIPIVPPNIQVIYFSPEQLINTNLSREGALFRFLTSCMEEDDDRDVQLEYRVDIAQQGVEEYDEEEFDDEDEECFEDLDNHYEQYLAEKRASEPTFEFQPPQF
jgi:hypothetical protein